MCRIAPVTSIVQKLLSRYTLKKQLQLHVFHLWYSYIHLYMWMCVYIISSLPFHTCTQYILASLLPLTAPRFTTLYTHFSTHSQFHVPFPFYKLLRPTFAAYIPVNTPLKKTYSHSPRSYPHNSLRLGAPEACLTPCSNKKEASLINTNFIT